MNPTPPAMSEQPTMNSNDQPQAAMQFLGEDPQGLKWYFADNSFTEPGIYYWNGTENVRVQAEMERLRIDLRDYKAGYVKNTNELGTLLAEQEEFDTATTVQKDWDALSGFTDEAKAFAMLNEALRLEGDLNAAIGELRRRPTGHGNCPDCNRPLSIVCDATGNNDYLVCFACEPHGAKYAKDAERLNRMEAEGGNGQPPPQPAAEESELIRCPVCGNPDYLFEKDKIDQRLATLRPSPVATGDELIPCPYCGTQDAERQCPKCHGKGWIRASRQPVATAGVSDGERDTQRLDWLISFCVLYSNGKSGIELVVPTGVKMSEIRSAIDVTMAVQPNPLTAMTAANQPEA